MKTGSLSFPLSEQIASNVHVHGESEAAKLLAKRVDFTTYYMLRFGRAPRFSTSI